MYQYFHRFYIHFAHIRASGVSPESIHIEKIYKFYQKEALPMTNETSSTNESNVLLYNNEHNWPDRSLGYLCRSYDNLNSGEDYIETKSAVHISFLNFTLFENNPEFCAKYMLLNVKNHLLFTSKFSLIVVELNNTELATDEYRMYGIDKWAKMFNSKSWEDLKMTAGEDKAMQEALKELYKYNTEEQVAKDEELVAKDEKLAAKDREIASLREQISKMSAK